MQFVHDYLQLHFDEGRLTVNAPLTVEAGGRTIAPRGSGWRDALCSCIDATVLEVLIERDQSLMLLMDNHQRLFISLRAEDQVTPEAAVFKGGDGIVVVFAPD